MRTFTLDQLSEVLRAAPARTGDDVSITMDGRRLDSKESVLRFLTELEEERAAGNPAYEDLP